MRNGRTRFEIGPQHACMGWLFVGLCTIDEHRYATSLRGVVGIGRMGVAVCT